MRLLSIGVAMAFVCFCVGLLQGCSGGSTSQGGGSSSVTTATALTVSPNPALQGATVTLTATVTSSGGAPTGTVTFADSGTTLGTGTLSSGVATFSIASLSTGNHNLAATYAGASGFSGSSSPAIPTVVTAPQNTTTTLTATPDPVVAGNSVKLSANTTASSGTPTGTITFYDSTTSLGTATLTGGIATITTSSLSVGTHSLTAAYGGVTGFNASTSTAVPLPVQTAIAITAHGTVTLTSTSANQTIAGFGGAEAFDLPYLDQHPNRAQMYTALFDPTQGLGLTFLRVQNSYYNYATAGANFDTDTPLIVSGANTAHGSPLTILMSSWTPPASIKSNNSTIGGTLRTVSGAYDYASFATFWYNSIVAYEALGVTPNYISIQNEPDFTATYVSCRFNPTEATFQGQSYAGYDKAFAAVYSAVQALPSPPKMIGPESFSTVNLLSYASALTTETPQSTEIYALAHHLYNVSSGDTNPDDGLTALSNLAAQYPTQLKYETEYYDAPGFLTAWNINNALTVGNDNAYFYWQLAWPSSSYMNNQGTDQEGLLYVENPYTPSSWQTKNGWTYNDSYYAFKHFSYFVKPGYVRYNATVDNTDERISVYQSSGAATTVIVVLNTSATATDGLSLNLSGLSYSSSTMYRSTFSTPITTGERWNNLGAATPAAGISLPPQSVVTIVLNK
jgi:glucuronoarabinoxylan endo-1,4-beta-xylanase